MQLIRGLLVKNPFECIKPLRLPICHLNSLWQQSPFAKCHAALVATVASAPRAMRYSVEAGHVPSAADKTFDKILIANRGEIAVRVIKTARRLGIKTVAVYSEPDHNALHVRLADEAVCIGPAPSAQSYLNVAAIMEAIKKTGAQAVHPGYGFLSENTEFCKALSAEGIVFIGPAFASIASMGDKIRSKQIAKEAGVSTIPGFQSVVRDAAHALALAQEIGYPVMLKASAGGGGKGMRIAWNAEQVQDNFELAAAESKSSFGDDRLLIEKYIDSPRHIEIQVIGDQHGHLVYLPERECSIQRRNQKVVEEAPSTFIDEATRKAMGEQAVALAKRVGYFSAGTVEFLVDSKRNFYFLEMNTRLQVEHPITELISRIDLVEWMIRVAAGHPLPLTDQQVINERRRGWAIEARIYAEDPKTYLPCIGRLKRYMEPGEILARLSDGCGETGMRCDSGIAEGSEISIYYDPMICKLSTFGKDRLEAIARMVQALDHYIIQGPTHNIPLLREIVTHPKFVSAVISTKFLTEEYPKGFDGHVLTDKELGQLSATAAAIHFSREQARYAAPTSPPGSALYLVKCRGKSLTVGIESLVSGYSVRVQASDGPVESYTIDASMHPTSLLCRVLLQSSAAVPISELTVQVLDHTSPLHLSLRAYGTVYDLQLMTKAQSELSVHMKPRQAVGHSNTIVSPMPGSVVHVRVAAGDSVREGTELIVVEAMKMQNVLRAQKAGKIKSVLVTMGQNVAAGDLLIEVE